MAQKTTRRRLTEDESWFKEGPVRGDARMDPPGGEGLSPRKPTRETTGKQDTRFKEQGDQWPRKHKGNLAMGTPESHGQTGEHESTHGEPRDGYTSETGHDWPDEPKNSGQGVAEPFDRTLEGTEMPKGTPAKGFGAGKAGEDSGVREGWDLNRIAAMVDSGSASGVELQQLFDSYARETDYVCLEHFAELCRAHGADNVLDENVLLGLMEANHDYVFHERQDASGSYWLPTPPHQHRVGRGGQLTEGKLPPALEKKKFGKKDGKKPKKGEHRPGQKVPGGLFQGKARSGGRRFQKPTAESADARCRRWMGIVSRVRNLLEGGHVTAEAAHRALQVSFNVHLDKPALLECSQSALQAVSGVVERHGLSLDRQLQAARHIWEGLYDGPDDFPPGEGPDDPFGEPGGPNMRVGAPGELAGASNFSGYDPDARGGSINAFTDDSYGDDPAYRDVEPGVPGMPDEVPPDLDDAGFDEVGPGMDTGEIPDHREPPPDEFGMDEPGFDPTPSGDRWGEWAGGSYGDDPVGDAMGHYREHGPAGGWAESRRRRRPVNEAGDWNYTADELPYEPGPPGEPYSAGDEHEAFGADLPQEPGMPGPGAGYDDYLSDGLSDEELDGPNDMSYMDDAGMNVPFGKGTTRGQYGAADRDAGAYGPGIDRDYFESRAVNRHELLEASRDDVRRIAGVITEDNTGWFSDEPYTAGGHEMDQDGRAVGGDLGDGADVDLPQDETGTTELHGKDLLGAAQENDLEGDGEFEHGGSGKLTGGHGPVKENIARLSRHVRRRLQECRAPAGKYRMEFAAVVADTQARKIRRAQHHRGLNEALADAEELLLIYGPRRVMLEAVFRRGNREIHRERIALPAVRRREPLVAEEGVVFRFPRHAELFARYLMAEGTSCRLQRHRWGSAVASSTKPTLRRRAFAAMLA